MPAPRKYPLELRERAVRMYRTAEPKPVIRRMAEELGVHHEALRNWIRQAEADAGERGDVLTSAEREELTAMHAVLKREVARVGRKRVERLMRQAGLAGISPRRGRASPGATPKPISLPTWCNVTSPRLGRTGCGSPTSP
ncbi:transposase [Streptomyces sp. NPDC058611]|uniref:transposase n=1 Tax=unclassified Streptomyces TaxID=2593676 RepID=UPI0036526D6C